jgi:hypothetical protein
MTSPVKSKGTRRDAEVYERTPSTRNHLRVVEPIHHKLLFHQKERWKTTPCPRLSSYQ